MLKWNIWKCNIYFILKNSEDDIDTEANQGELA